VAMEKMTTQSNIIRYKMPHMTYAIAPLSHNTIFTFDGTSYSVLNVDEEKTISTKKLNTELYGDIFVHPQRNIIGMFSKRGIHIFSDYDLLSKPFQDNYDSNFLFSAHEPIFFVAANKALVSCNYESPSQKNDVLVKDWGMADRPNYIFCCPTEKRPYFLYTGSNRSRICKIIKKDSFWSAQVLLDVNCFVKEDQCAYSPLGYICALTCRNKNLYIINTETLDQRVWSENIRVKDLIFLPNHRILSLLSENEDKIHFIDSKNWKEILHIDVPLPSSYNKPKLFSFSDSRRIMIFDDNVSYPDHKSQLLVINLPFFISHIDEYEQYPIIKLIECLNILPHELKKMIVAYLVALSKSE
jgi:hypothetical protein